MPKGEGLYPAPTKKRINDLDAQISNIQKGTRALIPAVVPLHDILRQKFRWYYRWTAMPSSRIINVLVLFIYIFGATWFGINSLFHSKTVLAAGNSCVSTAAGNWNTPATWGTSCGGVAPQPGDSVSVLDGHIVTLDVDSSVASVTIAATGTLDISNRTLTLSGTGTPLVKTGTLTTTGSTVIYTGAGATNVATVAYNNLRFSGAGPYNQTGNLTTTNAIGGTLTIDADATFDPKTYGLTVNGAFSNSGNFGITGTRPSGVHIFSSTWTNSGTFFLSANASATTISGNMTCTGTLDATSYGSLTVNGAAVNFATGTYIKTPGSLLPGQNVFKFSRAGAQTFTPAAGSDFGMVQTSIASTNVTVSTNNLVLTKLTIDASTTFNISNITMTITGSGTPFVKTGTFTTSGSTVKYTGTSATTPTATTYNNLELVPAATVTYTLGSVTCTGNLTVGNGTNAVTVSGAFTITGNYLIKANAIHSGTGAMSIAGNLTIDAGAVYTATGTITFNGTAAATFTDSTTSKQNVGKIVVTKTNGTPAINKLTLATAMTCPTMTISANNTLDITNQTLTLTGVGTPFIKTGTLVFDGSTVKYSQPSLMVSKITATTYNNLEITPTVSSSTSAATLGTASGQTLTCNGNFTIGDGSKTFTATAATYNPTINVAGNFTINTGITYTKGSGMTTFNGAIAATYTDNTAGIQNLGAVTVNKTDTTAPATNNKLTLASAMKADSLVIDGTAGQEDTLNLNGQNINVAGNWANSGTFTAGTGTVTFDGTAIGKTINPGASSFYNLTFNGSGGAWSPLTNTVTVTNDLTMTAGAFDTSNGTADVVVNGNVACGASCGTINMNTFTQNVAANKNFGTSVAGTAAWSFYNLVFTKSAGTPTIATSTTATGDINVWNVLTIGAGTTLDAGNRTWRLGGASIPFVKTGTLVPNASVFSFETGGTILSTTYYNIQFGSAAGPVSYTLSAGTLSVNNFSIFNAGPSPATVDAETNDPTITVAGNFSNVSEQIFSASSTAAFTVSGNWTNSGTFTAGTGTVTFDGTDASTLYGPTTFYNLVMNTTGIGAKTIKFVDGTTQTVNGTWTLDGDIGKVLTLRSTADGTAWKFVIPANFTAGDYIDVKDSQNTINAYRITPGANTTDSGNNDPGWDFKPTAPTILAPVVASATVIQWHFTDTASNETGFKVYDSSDNLVVTCATANLAYCTETGLSVNAQYTGRYVVAYNAIGNSPHSAAAASIYTLANTPLAPLVVANYTEADGYFTDLTLDSNGNPDGTQYKINTSDWQAQNDGATFKQKDLECNQNYVYSILARNGDLVETAEIEGSDTTPLCPPNNLTETNLMADSVTLGWSAAEGANPVYDIGFGTDESATNLGITSDISDLSLDQKSLDSDTTYYYMVRSHNDSGIGAWSAIKNFTTLANAPSPSPPPAPDNAPITPAPDTTTPDATTSGTAPTDEPGISCTEKPSAPSNFRATLIGSNKINLTWAPSVSKCGLNNYNVFNAHTGIKISSTTSMALDLTDLVSDMSYSFFVIAIDVAGNTSEPSNTLTIKTSKVGGNVDSTENICHSEGGQVAFLILGNTPTEIVSGQAFPENDLVKVMVADGGGELCDAYRGMVYFTSSDSKANLTWNINHLYNFTEEDAGKHEFNGTDFRFYTEGEQILGITDKQFSAKAEIKVISNNINIQKAQYAIKGFFDHNSMKVNTTAVAATTGLLLTPVLVNLAIGLSNLLPQIIYWVTQILLFAGLRRKRKPWGVVFNSQTGQPVTFAMVRLFHKERQCLLESTITDKKGRFGLLVRPGTYYIIVSKTGFNFPSQFKVSEFFENVYSGGSIHIDSKTDKIVNLNIPVDPQAKKSVVFSFWVIIVKFNRFLQKIRLPIMVIGLIFAVIMIVKSYHLIYVLSLILYGFFLILELFRSKKSKPHGVVSDVFGKPLETAIVRIFNKRSNRLVSTDVSDSLGRFNFLVDPGIYYLMTTKPGYMDFKSHILYLERERITVTTNIKLKKSEKQSQAKIKNW